MTKKTDWDNEAEAARLVSKLVGGEAVKRDIPGGQPSTHDFDIEMPDGRIIALEVTQEVDSQLLAQDSLEAKLDWRFAELAHNWYASVQGTVDLKALHQNISGLLEQLEGSGPDIFRVERLDTDQQTQQFRQLGLRYVSRRGKANGPGNVVLGRAAVHGSTSPEIINSVVERHAGLRDNQQKFDNTPSTSEVHLFIWVHSDRHHLTAAIQGTFLPDVTPLLPDNVDCVWVATALIPPTVWKLDSGGWQSVPSPTT